MNAHADTALIMKGLQEKSQESEARRRKIRLSCPPQWRHADLMEKPYSITG